jgi:hypothetical protein
VVIFAGKYVSASRFSVDNVESRDITLPDFSESFAEFMEEWLLKIGFHNLNRISRYQVWKAKGYCPPDTTLKDRREMMKSAPGWQRGDLTDCRAGLPGFESQSRI